MKRINEVFDNYELGQQVVYDRDGLGVGQIVDDGGVKCLDMHPSYPGRNPAYLPMKELGRQPSCDLSSSTMQGQALNHKIAFKVYKHTSPAGYVLDSIANIGIGNGSRIRLGHDGNRWYCYVCVPLNGITPTAEFSLVKPLDDGWHDFAMAIRHNRIVGSLDGQAFTIPYTVDKAWTKPDVMTWTAILYSSATFSVRYKSIDFSIQN